MHTAYAKKHISLRRTVSDGFTIVELLIVIIVLGILATLVMTVVNPAEITRQTRDSVRVSDLKAIDRVIALSQIETTTQIGSSNTIYISLPDSNANCSTYALPTLPGGWAYACKPAASYRNIDGTGWIPVDISSASSSSKMPLLPVDPVNTLAGKYYYSFMSGTGWELNTTMEALSNTVGGNYDKESTDGGDDPTKLEIGNNLAIAPWSFEFSTFTTVANNSGFPGWYRSSGTSTITIGSDGTATNYMEAAGYGWYGWQENIAYNPNSTYKMTCKARQVTDPTVGGKGIYCGWNGVAADGVTLVNVTGVNTTSSQHYQTMAGISLTAGAAWSTYNGYTKG